MKVVLDTNILISAFIFPGGSPDAVYRHALEGRIEIVTSPVLLAELARVLSDKFDWEPMKVEEAVKHIARLSTVVRPTERVSVVAADPDDDRVLEAALAGGAAAIVSGDKHLLRLKRWHEIDVVDAAAFMAAIVPMP